MTHPPLRSRVRVTNPKSADHDRIGIVRGIEDDDGTIWCSLIFGSGKDMAESYPLADLEVIAEDAPVPKVGDRVLIDRPGFDMHGKLATITSIDEAVRHPLRYTIRIDGHSGTRLVSREEFAPLEPQPATEEQAVKQAEEQESTQDEKTDFSLADRLGTLALHLCHASHNFLSLSKSVEKLPELEREAMEKVFDSYTITFKI